MKYKLTLTDEDGVVLNYWGVCNDESYTDELENDSDMNHYNLDKELAASDLVEEIGMTVGMSVHADLEAQKDDQEAYKESFWNEVDKQADPKLKEKIKEFREKEAEDGK